MQGQSQMAPNTTRKKPPWLEFKDFIVGSKNSSLHEYIKTWLLHSQYLSFINYLPPPKATSVVGFHLNLARTQHGAFYTHAQPVRHDKSPEPAPHHILQSDDAYLFSREHSVLPVNA